MLNKEWGRPADAQTRSPVELACYDMLDCLGVAYERVDHEVHMTMADCGEVDELLEIRTCKNLFLTNRQKTKFYLLMMDGEKQFKTKVLSTTLDVARLSFASAEDMQKYLGLTPGSVTVLGLMNDSENAVQLVIDQSVADEKKLGCHPCENTSTLSINMKDLIEKILPLVGHTPIYVDLPEEEA